MLLCEWNVTCGYPGGLEQGQNRVGLSNRASSFLLCNEGFTIERFIHGMEAEYNDIAAWDFKELVTVFGGTDETSRKLQVKTRDELDKLLKEDIFNEARGVQLVEVYMPKEDAPKALVMTAEASASTNARLD
jgi:pyruvate decarboxylase